MRFLLRVAILAATAAAAFWLSRGAPERVTGRARIADGDTLQFETVRVRLVGIDAPEFDQQCGEGTAMTSCGRQARDHLRRLAGDRVISCAGDGSDRFGRLLAVCTAGDKELNRAMVRDGWAVASDDYFGEEAEARAARRGIWAGSFDSPRQWRRDHPRDEEVAAGGLVGNLLGWLDNSLTAVLDWFRSLLGGADRSGGNA